MILALVVFSHPVNAQEALSNDGLGQRPSSPTTSTASTIPTYRTTSLLATETTPGDLYIAGETVTIAGTVNGDLYVAGGQVDLTGTVTGDVIVAGGQLNLSGTIGGNLRGVGGQAFVSSAIAKNMSLVAGTLNVDSSTQLTGNMTAAGGTVRLDSPLAGSATLLAGTLDVRKPIQGNLTYATDPKSTKVDESLITGTVTRHEFQQPDIAMRKPDPRAKHVFMTLLGLVHLISQLVVGLLLIYLLPKFMLKSADTFGTQTLKSIGVGVITMIVLPFVAIFLFFTLIGIPLGIITFIGYAGLLYVGQFVAHYAVGRYVTNKLGKKWQESAVYVTGLLTLTLIGLIPIIGWLACMLAHVAGVGALAMTKKEMIVMLREKKMI